MHEPGPVCRIIVYYVKLSGRGSVGREPFWSKGFYQELPAQAPPFRLLHTYEYPKQGGSGEYSCKDFSGGWSGFFRKLGGEIMVSDIFALLRLPIEPAWIFYTVTDLRGTEPRVVRAWAPIRPRWARW